MSERILVLGGSGLVGAALAARAAADGARVVVADLDPVRGPSLDYEHVDLTKPGALGQLVRRWSPHVVFDALNLATFFSEQRTEGYDPLIRYHTALYEALEARRRPLSYLRVGTTGSGGLGFDLPFTHGDRLEDQPILHKAAFAGAATQLLVLISRSFPRSEVRVLEIKPGAAIFDEAIGVRQHRSLRVVTARGGESGSYTRDELTLLTRFMGFTTPARVAEAAFEALAGGHREPRPCADVIGALDTAILSEAPADVACRDALIARMAEAEHDEPALPATGNLGPPTICRDLVLAAAALAGQGPDGEIARDAIDYLAKTQPTLVAWLGREDLEAAQRDLHVEPDASAPWQVVYGRLRRRRR